MANVVNERLKAAAKYAKTVAREGRDVVTALGTTATDTRKAKDAMQASRINSATWNNFDKQVSEAVKAITKGEKGTRSTIHKTDFRKY